MANEPMQLIGRRYELHEIIGRGGMGIVYRSLDRQTGTSVAIKHLKPELTTPDIIRRFQHEGEALRKLNHPNIVKLLNVVQEGTEHYLVIELIEGGSLRNLLDRNAMLSTATIMTLGLDICDALTRSHRLDIIHRDIKPANVLIADDSTPRLSDFGIARETTSDSTASGEIMGTFAYLSPEILQRGQVSKVSDIWALGVTFFEMLTGERPFHGEQTGMLLTAILTQPVPDLEKMCPDAPIDLIDLVYRMLAKNPAERIPSIRLVGAELEALLQGYQMAGIGQHKLALSQEFNNEEATFIVDNRFATSSPVSHQFKHNLPAQITAFIGRSVELAELTEKLNDPAIRLVTVLGLGGIGKTRLALEVAQGQYTNFANGVYLIDLASLDSPDGITLAIAEAVNYPFQQDGRSQKDQLIDYFSHKEMLLIIDNFEHVLAGATLVTEILREAPHVKIMATSRHKLNQSGENIFELTGLQQEDEAVQLFLQSAVRVSPAFELTPENRKIVEQICKLIDGLPLGILLAASWLSVLTIEEIGLELQQDINFLETEMSDLPERHRSIRAVFDYSWDLLTDTEQEVFMKLSVFRGGFTREAAQGIADVSLRNLLNLTNKSLIRRNADNGRFEVHELLRQYAEEKLSKQHLIEVTNQTHCAFFAEFLNQLESDIKGRQQLKAYRKVVADIENIRTAWLWASKFNQISEILKMLETLSVYNMIKGDHQRFSELLQYTLDTIDLNENQLAKGYLSAHILRPRYTGYSGDIKTLLDETLAIAKVYADLRLKALVHFIFGVWYTSKLDYSDAITNLEQAIELFTEIDHHYLPECYFSLSFANVFSGDPDKAETLREKALEIGRENGNLASICWPMNAHAWTLIMKHEDIENGLRLGRESLQIANDFDSQVYEGLILTNIGYFLFFEGQFDEAYHYASLAKKLANEINHDDMSGAAVRILALLAAIENRYEDALSLANVALDLMPQSAIGRRFGAQFAIALASCGTRNIAQLVNSLEYYFKKNWIGQSWGSLHHGLIPASFLLSFQGEFTRSTEILGLALSRKNPPPGWMQKWSLISDLQEILQNELGRDNYQQTFERGRSLELETIVQELLNELDSDNQT